MQDSNLRPPVCDTDALPTELIAHSRHKNYHANLHIQAFVFRRFDRRCRPNNSGFVWQRLSVEWRNLINRPSINTEFASSHSRDAGRIWLTEPSVLPASCWQLKLVPGRLGEASVPFSVPHTLVQRAWYVSINIYGMDAWPNASASLTQGAQAQS